jgi:hypothetical protein
MSMVEPVRALGAMLARLDPALDPQPYDFITGAEPQSRAIATFRESEGWSSIVPEDGGAMRRITLQVYSHLEGVGLTAAVATLLADHGISCNMVAAYHHDHLFVPAANAERALSLLRSLQAGSGGSSPAAVGKFDAPQG